MRATIVLVDAALELVPGSQTGEVLDAHTHGHLMDRLQGAGQRGRPDIIHRFLSLCHDSRPFGRGDLDAVVHTRNDEVIRAERGTIPWNYGEFLRIMGGLLMGQDVEGIGLTRGMGLEELLLEIGGEKAVALSPRGRITPLAQVLEGGVVTLLIGGFPEGDYISDVYSLADEVVSLDVETLTTWSVTCEVLCALSAYQPLS